MTKVHIKTVVKTIVLLIITLAIISFPKEVTDAAKTGLTMWWGIVFPALLPFFVLSNLLMQYGIVEFIGIIFEPIMRPFYRVPGVGSFPLSLGLISGFPAGAKLTAELRQANLITQAEGERLVCFTNAANPLFIFGAVATGFLHRPELGIIIAVAHYGGNVLVGMIMRFYRYHEVSKPQKINGNIFKRAFYAMHKKNQVNSRPLGSILGTAVTDSVQTLLMIGGFIIIFSVLNRLMWQLHFLQYLLNFCKFILPTELTKPLFTGFLEMTNGIAAISHPSTNSLALTLLGIAFILGFSGLSIHAQVASILATTDISYLPFFWSKILHGTLATIITYTLIQNSTLTTEVLKINRYYQLNYQLDLLFTYGPLLTILTLLLYAIILLKHNRVEK